MSKIYYEMNDKERQLHHIANDVDYAISVLAEGLSGSGEYNISTQEVINLQSEINNNLIKAHEGMIKLLRSIKNESEEKLC